MALTGICLVLFVTFHVLMNSVALLWPAAYNVICEFLGANWYALVASMGLAALFVIHILYAVWLTVQNRKARGNDRYAVAGAAPGVEWSSKNMLVLGIVIVAFLVVHLIQFWAKMQLQELTTHELTAYATVDNVPAAPHFGTLFLQAAFEHWYTPVIYIIGFVALWFHMNHGFWSMFHTIGWDNNIWIKRLKCIGCWWTTIVIALFVAQAVLFTVQAGNRFFLTDQTLQEQYAEYWNDEAAKMAENFQTDYTAVMQKAGGDMMAQQEAHNTFFATEGDAFYAHAMKVAECAKAQAPDVVMPAVMQLEQLANAVAQQTQRAAQTVNMTNPEPNQE